MSYFATELEAVMAEKKIGSAAELSKVSGVDQATLSRVRSGAQEISHQDLDRIAAGINPGSKTHARLLAARLRDELRPPGGPLIEIELRGTDAPVLREASPRFGTKLPPKMERIFDILARNIDDTEVRSILGGLATLCDRGTFSPRFNSSKDTEDKNRKEISEAGARAVPGAADPKKQKAP